MKKTLFDALQYFMDDVDMEGGDNDNFTDDEDMDDDFTDDIDNDDEDDEYFYDEHDLVTAEDIIEDITKELEDETVKQKVTQFLYKLEEEKVPCDLITYSEFFAYMDPKLLIGIYNNHVDIEGLIIDGQHVPESFMPPELVDKFIKRAQKDHQDAHIYKDFFDSLVVDYQFGYDRDIYEQVIYIRDLVRDELRRYVTDVISKC